MTQFLPANLLALFAPRDPLPYLPPPQPKHLNEECTLTGIGVHASLFEDPAEAPEPVKSASRAERREAKRREKEAMQQKVVDDEALAWDPHNDPNASGDAFKTVFVSRINYDTREDKLRREFEEFGYIRKVNMVKDIRTGKPRGYAFIEYETEKGMRSAYKYGDGKKIDGRRVVVDIERGRTVKNWKPRKFGGGLGGARIGAPEFNIAHSGRVDPRQYQEKLDKAERARQRLLNPGPDERDRSRSRDKSRARSHDKSRDQSRDRSDRRRSADRERSGKDEDKPDKPISRRIRRDGDRKDEERERRPRERDDDRRRERDDRKRDRKDEDRDRDRDRDRKRDRRDRGDRDRGDRDRDRGDRGGDKDRSGDRDRSEKNDKDKESEKEKSVVIEDVENEKDFKESKAKEEDYSNEPESVS